MTAATASLRTLLRTARRRGERMEAELVRSKEVQTQRDAELQAATDEHTRLVTEESDLCSGRGALMSAAFSMEAVRVLDVQIEAAKASVQQAERTVGRRRDASTKQLEVVRAAQAAVRRNEQRIDQFRDRLDALLKERETAVEEAEDEEAQETAASRLAGRRQAAESAA